MTYTLYGGKVNKNTYKGLIAAKYAGVKVDLKEGFEIGKDNKTPEFLKLNPCGKVFKLSSARQKALYRNLAWQAKIS